MSLFGIKTIIKDPFDRDIFDKGPSLIEKIDMIFTDVELEGEKKGYKRAASEYEITFKEIENEYEEVKELIESMKSSYVTKSDKLIAKLSELERQKISLQKQVERKTKDVSIKYDISFYDVRSAAIAGTLISKNPMGSILDLIYNHKEKKLKEAEQKGYFEAKKLYEEKIAKMKKNLQELKIKGSSDIKNLIDMINDLFGEIAEEQMKIADLKILL